MTRHAQGIPTRSVAPGNGDVQWAAVSAIPDHFEQLNHGQGDNQCLQTTLRARMAASQIMDLLDVVVR